MKNFGRFILIFTFIVLQSCGKNSINNHEIEFDQSMSHLSVQELLDEHTVSCQGSACPDSVAKIIIKTSKGVGQCSGFLVGKNLMMTSGHCIPKADLKRFHDCQDKIGVKFPTNQDKFEEVAICKKVLVYSEGKSKLDYLVFELDRNINREFSKISQMPVGNFQKLHAWAMNPLSTTHGHFIKKECLSIRNSLLIPEATSDYFPVAQLADCVSIPGNSGAPIFDEAGNARALISGVFKKDYIEKVTAAKPIFENLSTSVKSEIMACMDLRLLGLNNSHGECKKFDLTRAYRVTSGSNFISEKAQVKKLLQQVNTTRDTLNQFSIEDFPVGQITFVNMNSSSNQTSQISVRLGYNRYLQPVGELLQN